MKECHLSDTALIATSMNQVKPMISIKQKIATGCELNTITPDQILRARLTFGIRNAKAWEIAARVRPNAEENFMYNVGGCSV